MKLTGLLEKIDISYPEYASHSAKFDMHIRGYCSEEDIKVLWEYLRKMEIYLKQGIPVIYIKEEK